MVLLLFLILLAREVTSQVNEDFVGGITILNKAAQDLTRRFPSWRPHREDCEKWNEWQNATCWWPSQNWEELPEACTVVLTSKKWPTYFQKLVEAKAKEKYDMIQAEYKARGSPPRCGFCSQSFKCRVRNTTDDSFFCPKKQVLNMPSECNDSAPCLISREKGGCPPPFFLNNNRIQRIRGFIERKDHQQVMKELLAAQAPPREDRKGFESSDPLPWEVRTRVKRHPMVNDNSAFDKIQFDLWGNPLSGVFAPRPVSELFGQDEIRMMPRPVPVMPMAPSSKSQRGHGLPMRPMRRLPRPVFGAPMSPQGPMGPLTPQGPQMPAFAPPPFVMNDHATIQMLKRRFGPFGPQILPFGPTRGFFPYFPPPPMPRVRPPPRGIRRPFTRNLQFIHELVHGTTCVSQMNVCLCCCGRYVPNVVNGTCEDITKLLPGIEGVVDDLVEKAKTEEEFKKSENSSEEANEKSKLVEEIKVTVPFEQTGNDDMMMPQLKQMKLKLKPTAKVTKMSEEFKL